MCAANNLGQTPLMLMCCNKYYPLWKDLKTFVNYIIDESKRVSYVNAIDIDGKSALSYAMNVFTPTNVVPCLLELSANPLIGSFNGSSIIMGILQSRDSSCPHDILEVVTKLVELGCDPKIRDHNGQTALHLLACYLFHLRGPEKELVNRLIEWGVDICAVDNLGRTPFLLACGYPFCAEDADLESFLPRFDDSKKNSIVNALDTEGKSAFMYALDSFRPIPLMLGLLEVSTNPFIGEPQPCNLILDLLRKAEDYSDPDLIMLITRLVEIGCDPKSRDESDGTALHIMAVPSSIFGRGNRTPLIASFIDWGLDECAVDMFGRTPLMLACSGPFAHITLLEIFLRHVSESKRQSYINAVDIEGKSALMYLSDARDSGSAILRFLELSADPFVGDPTGSRLLARILNADNKYRQTIEAFMKLLQLGCDPNAPNERGQTALHVLAMKSTKIPRFIFLKVLLKYNVNPMIQDNEGNLAL